MTDTDETVTLISKLDALNQPILNNCTVMTGSGERVVFRNGRADAIPRPIAERMANGSADVEALPPSQTLPVSPTAGLGEEASATAPQTSTAGTMPAQVPTPPVSDADNNAELEAARAHLLAEGFTVADLAPDAEAAAGAPAEPHTDGDPAVGTGPGTPDGQDTPRVPGADPLEGHRVEGEGAAEGTASSAGTVTAEGTAAAEELTQEGAAAWDLEALDREGLVALIAELGLEVDPVEHTDDDQLREAMSLAIAEEVADDKEAAGLVTKNEDGVKRAMPAGFEANTSEGEPRCIAPKADGSQCANAAVGDTQACGIAKHKAAVAELPAIA